VAIWQHRKRVFGIFSPHMRRNSWARHSLRQFRFLIRQMYFYYRVTFTGYIRCFCATTLYGFVTLTFDPLTLRVSCTVLLMSDPHNNFYYLTSIGYWVTSTEYLITFPLSETVTVHRRSPKTTRNNFWPRNAYSIYNFYAATMMIKGSLYLSIRMLKRFSVAKKRSAVKIGSRNGGFSEIEGVQI